MKNLIIKHLGTCDYHTTWQAMRDFTDTRNENTPDEIWLLEHTPVYTLGQAGKMEHVLNAGEIPLIRTDRGGQVTYHGPGQLMVYALLDLRRLGIGIRELVTRLENTVIAYLAHHRVQANNRCDAPGVYVNDAKICSIGLRVRRGCCYHGIAFNVNMDLTPFSRINPCGYRGLQMTQLKTLGGPDRVDIVAQEIPQFLVKKFGYTL